MKEFVRQNWSLVIDLLVLAVLVFITWQAWKDFQPSADIRTRLDHPEERAIALDAVSGGVGAATTGASIILGVIGAIAGLGKNLDAKARAHLRFGAAFCGLSLLVAVWNGTVLPQYANTQNLSLVSQVGVGLAIQGYAMFFAMLRLLLGTWHIFAVGQ